MSIVLIVPSLKISGGTREALRLATDANTTIRPAQVLSMWDSPHAMPSELPVTNLSRWEPRARNAPLQIPVLMHRFSRWLKQRAADVDRRAYIFTHYATLPLALLVPRDRRWFFVQDLEWRFVSNPIAMRLLRLFVKSVYKTGRLVSANAYLSQALKQEGLTVTCETPIWAGMEFESAGAEIRDIDFVMVLRKGAHKRIDLYLQFIEFAAAAAQRVAVITPEDDIAATVANRVHILSLRPDAAQMRDLYGRSKCFIHASEHEGFGLPPLEAMGSGCVPFCRDSGGVRAYMDNEAMRDLLMPLSLPIREFHARASILAANAAKLKAYSKSAQDIFASGAELTAKAKAELRNTLG